MGQAERRRLGDERDAHAEGRAIAQGLADLVPGVADDDADVGREGPGSGSSKCL